VFTTKSQIPIDIAAMLPARQYQGNGNRTSTPEMNESTSISVCISMTKESLGRQEGHTHLSEGLLHFF
jgi:hypothetical protein